MNLSSPLREDADVLPGNVPALRRNPEPSKAKRPDRERYLKLSSGELAFRLVAAFRAHPHIGNVLTHISRTKWSEVERSLNAILDPVATSQDLSPLAQNIVDLMCAERGITGKIVKPYFHDILYALLERDHAGRLIRRIESLFFEIERKAQNQQRLESKERRHG